MRSSKTLIIDFGIRRIRDTIGQGGKWSEHSAGGRLPSSPAEIGTFSPFRPARRVL